MFILKKILNSDTTSPDLITLNAGTEGYRYGTFLKLGDNGVLSNIGEAELPTHMCCENVPKGVSKAIRCFPVTDEMVFSAPTACEMGAVLAGTRVSLVMNEADYVNSVAEDAIDGKVFIYDTCGAKKPGDRLLIRFAR